MLPLAHAVFWPALPGPLHLLVLAAAVGLGELLRARRHRRQRARRAGLRRENLHGQLRGLRSQFGPHFLFNSLNSLSALIADEPAQAEQFVDELTRVCCYLLETTSLPAEDELTTLGCELAFINSYCHLLGVRHGAGLRCTVQVPAPYWQHRLPPLTLQLLVENVVKHNVLLASQPLHLTIATTARGWLRVRNTWLPKATRANLAAPARTGLAGMQARYRLLAPAGVPHIEAGPAHFTVTLPLLAPSPFAV